MTAALPPAARTEFAAGWPLVLGAAIAIGVGMMGVGFYALGLFVKPLQEEFGWSRAAVSGAATFQQLGIFLSAPIVGRLADRFGVRRIALVSYVLTPLAFVAMAQVGPSLIAWYGIWLLASIAGCGTTPAIWARVVSGRFDKGRGLALGLMLLGTGTAAIVTPAFLGPIFVEQGWRSAVLTMAGAIALLGLPVSLALKSDAPAKGADTGPRGRFEANRATLTLLVIAFLLGLLVAGLLIHLVPMLTDRGIATADAVQVAASVGVAVVAARVVVGYLFDRFHAPYIAALFLISPVVSALLLWLGGPVVPAALLLGLAAGAEVDMLAYFTSRYAHMSNYSATYGVVLGLFCFGAAFGPLSFGWSVDLTGNYDIALVTSAVLLSIVVVLIARLGPYLDGKEST